MTRRLASLLLILLLAAPALAQRRPPRGERRPGPVTRPAAHPGPGGRPARAPTAPAAAGTTPESTAAPGAPSTEAPGEDADLYQCKKFKPNARIKVTLKPDTDLKDLVAWVMGFTCKSFIFGNAISGRANKVTIIAPSQMTPQEAYRLFLVGLQTMNLTVVPKGRTLEITESNRGREMPVPVYKSGHEVPGQDQVVRMVLRPQHVSADELASVLNAMKTTTGVITPVPSAGVLIITDYGSMIDKMLEVVKEIDAPTGADRIYIIYLQNADAKDIAAKLTEIFSVGGSRGGSVPVRQIPGRPVPRGAAAMSSTSTGTGGSIVPTKIIADDRTNSLIVIASERAYERILALVRRLDAAAGGEEGTIHVYYLSNADAETLAGTMNTIITGQAPRTATATRGRVPTRPTAARTTTGGAIPGAFEGQIKVTHDKPTNSLVIVSSPKDYYALREVIKKLDKPRRQVFVEATIVEVSLNKTRTIGISYHGGDQFQLKNPDDSTIFGGFEPTKLKSIGLPASAVSVDGLIGGVVGPLIPGLSIPSIGVLFQLLQNNSEVNVLSMPNILTTDNEPAEISVGQNIPYLSSTLGNLGSLAGATGTTGTTTAGTNLGLLGLGGLGQSIQRQDVALTLKLTPHISESDVIRLEVDLEISDVLDPDFGGHGPSWSKRKVKTPIVVKDQQPVVIGGLMSNKETVTEAKVPLLGDIPLLGYLFKYHERQKIKTNLLVFLTPYVIKDQSDIQRIFEEKVEERREFIRAYSSLETSEIKENVDYRRKRGLLEEINKAIQSADEDERLLEQAQQARQRLGQEGPVELPSDVKGSAAGAGEHQGAEEHQGPEEHQGEQPPPEPAAPPPEPEPEE